MASALAMCRIIKELTVKTRNLAKLYLIEIKRVTRNHVTRSEKRGEGENAG